MHESTQHPTTTERIFVARGNSVDTHTIFSRRDRAGLAMIRVLCKTPQEIDIHAFVRGDLKTFGASIGALVFHRAKNRVLKARVHP